MTVIDRTTLSMSEAATSYAEQACYQESNIPMVRSAYLTGAREEASRLQRGNIISLEALEALPAGSVVLSSEGGVFERAAEGHWESTGSTYRHQSSDISLPASRLL